MAFRIGLVASFALLSFANNAHAAVTAPVTLSISQTYPAPYSQITVTPRSTTIDLAASTLKASVNGAVVYEGSTQPFSVTLGASGTKTSITAAVTTNGRTYTETTTLVPQDVALVLEPLGSAPVLYAGKPLVSLEGQVRVVAVTDFRTASGARIKPSALSYTWTVENTIVQNSSGIGKDSLVVDTPLQYRQRSVSVVVKTTDGTLVSGGSLTFSGTEPSVRVYESDALLGIRFERALSGTFSIPGSEISLFAAPYSFSRKGGAPAISWFLNGASAQTGNLLTLRPQGSGQGTASLSVTAQKAGLLESASSALSLTFGSSGNGIFGL